MAVDPFGEGLLLDNLPRLVHNQFAVFVRRRLVHGRHLVRHQQRALSARASVSNEHDVKEENFKDKKQQQRVASSEIDRYNVKTAFIQTKHQFELKR